MFVVYFQENELDPAEEEMLLKNQNVYQFLVPYKTCYFLIIEVNDYQEHEHIVVPRNKQFNERKLYVNSFTNS